MNNAVTAGDRTLEIALYAAWKRRVQREGERERERDLYKLIPAVKYSILNVTLTEGRSEVDCNSVLTII